MNERAKAELFSVTDDLGNVYLDRGKAAFATRTAKDARGKLRTPSVITKVYSDHSETFRRPSTVPEVTK